MADDDDMMPTDAEPSVLWILSNVGGGRRVRCMAAGSNRRPLSRIELKAVSAMIETKNKAKAYKSAITAARAAGGDEGQSHMLSRLRAVMKRRPKAEKKPPPRSGRALAP
jgi:hypothetical protein